MELCKTFMDIIYNKTCFLCFKVSPDLMDITELLEIREPSSIKLLKMSEIVQYLFPSLDILCTGTCRLCSDLLIKMYLTMFKHNFVRRIITTMTDHCYNVIDKTKAEKQLMLDLKLPSKKDKRKIANQLTITSKQDHVSNIDQSHRYKHKKRKKLYNCDHCSYTSLCKGSLVGHINKYHTKTRPFSCDVCLKSFYSKSNLREHKQMHNRVCVCEICGDIFARKQSLINHLKLHSNDRAYRCMLCEKSFINSSRRLDHMKRNHFEKNECCMFCDKRFGMKKELIRHVKSVHA